MIGKSARGHRGATLLLVVLTLIVIAALMSAMIRHLSLANRQLRQHARKAQAIVLTEAGLERAVSALRSDASYEKETWKISADQLSGQFAATVDIEVTRDASRDLALIHVAAIYPDSSDFRATVRRQIEIDYKSQQAVSED